MLKRLFSFEANPVLLYELRQMVRNRTVIGLMVLYLAALVAFLGLVLAARAWGNPVALDNGGFYSLGYANLSYETQIALFVFLIYYVFTTLALVAFAAFKTGSERLGESPVYTTMLRPRRLILGKMLFGVVLSLLFLCMTLPFLSAIYLLRGLDIRVLPVTAFVMFCMTQIHYFTAVALMLGAKNRRRLVALLLPGLALQFLFGFFTLTQCCDISTSLVFHVSGPEFWYGVGMLVTVFLLSMLAVFILSMVQVAPEASNRMLPVRVTLGIVQLLLGLAILGVCVVGISKGMYWSDYNYVLVPGLLVWLVIPFLFVFFICERDDWSPRIRRTIPRSTWGRLLVFPFYTGAANAMVWSVLSLFWSAFCITAFMSVFSSAPDVRDYFQAGIVGTATYGFLFFDYCATSLILYNLLLCRRMSRQWNWVPLVVFLVLIVLLGLFLDLVGSAFGIDFLSEFLDFPILPLPWLQEEMKFVIAQGWIAGAWFLLLSPVGVPWLYIKFKRFRREDPLQNSFVPPS